MVSFFGRLSGDVNLSPSRTLVAPTLGEAVGSAVVNDVFLGLEKHISSREHWTNDYVRQLVTTYAEQQESLLSKVKCQKNT